MKQIEAPSMSELPQLYHELADFMRKCGDRRHPDEALAYILKQWLATAGGGPPAGYQWGDVYLPDGTELRLQFLNELYFASVENGQLIHLGLPISPRAWCLEITGSVRNPWRDILVRRNPCEGWTRARTLRKNAQQMRAPSLPDRRVLRRRAHD